MGHPLGALSVMWNRALGHPSHPPVTGPLATEPVITAVIWTSE
jgi:hypothetical protein